MATGMSTVTKQNMSTAEFLLEGEFEVFPNEKLSYKVEITKHGLTYYPSNEDRTSKNKKYIHFGDVIGCRCRKSLDDKHLHKAYLTVFTYPLKKKLFSDKWIRNKHPVTFARSCDSSFDANRKVVEKWRRVILHLCQRLPLRKKDVERCQVPPKRRLLVLINPFSGPGRAVQIYEKQVAPMLDEADIQVKVVKTEHAGHAKELMQTVNRKDYSGVVIVSGDGLIFEVINGLMSREDWQDAIKLPVGCIPGGSGNALSCAINYSAGEPIDTEMVFHATFVLIKHRVIPMDLALIEQLNNRIYSFLSVTWGLMADIDYESEKYRAIGKARFTLQAVKRILDSDCSVLLPSQEYKIFCHLVMGKQSLGSNWLNKIMKKMCTELLFCLEQKVELSNFKLALRKYRAKLSFLPISQYIPKSSINNNSKIINIPKKSLRVSLQSFDGGESEDTDNFSDRMRSKSMPSEIFKRQSTTSDISENGIVEQLSDLPDQNGDLVFESENSGSSNQVNFSLETSTSEEPRNFYSTECDSSESLQEILKLLKQPGKEVPSNLLTPLDEPVPDNWVTIDDEFINVVATYQSHLGSDLFLAPDARFADGLIHLCFIRAGIQKSDLFQLMSKLEDGTHLEHDSEYCEFVKVLAFRIEPENDKGLIMIDGEKFDAKPIQGQILPALANVMAIQ